MPYAIARLVVTEFESNCYVLYEDDGSCLVIDPGGEPDLIWAFVQEKGLQVRQILDTHGHLDHCSANAPLRRLSGAPVAIGEPDADMLSDPVANGSVLFGWDFELHRPDTLLRGGDSVGHGSMRFEVLPVPGHSAGSCMYYDRVGGNVFCGDLVFRGGIGRYDLPGSDGRQLADSILGSFLCLPDETAAYPGHGEPTTVRRERKANPYIVDLVRAAADGEPPAWL